MVWSSSVPAIGCRRERRRRAEQSEGELRTRLTMHPLTPDRWADLNRYSEPGAVRWPGCWCNGPPAERLAARATRLDSRRVEPPRDQGAGGRWRETRLDRVSRRDARRVDLARPARALCEAAPFAGDEASGRPARVVDRVLCRSGPVSRSGGGARAPGGRSGYYARKSGARFLEAYPVDKPRRSPDDFLWFGAKSMFDAAGFKEIARRKPARPAYACGSPRVVTEGPASAGPLRLAIRSLRAGWAT